jgi:hypothetical protein
MDYEVTNILYEYIRYDTTRDSEAADHPGRSVNRNRSVRLFGS